jgi:hypothetical protein
VGFLIKFEKPILGVITRYLQIVVLGLQGLDLGLVSLNVLFQTLVVGLSRAELFLQLTNAGLKCRNFFHGFCHCH